MSLVTERRMALGEVEKEKFRIFMRQVEDFCGVQSLAYARMGNNLHIIVHVPEREEIPDKELVRRVGLLYPKLWTDDFDRRLREERRHGHEAYAEQLRKQYLYRMYDVSQFMKTLKQRFTMWFNRRNQRKGTLWEERFKSVLIEASEAALRTVAAYIDLNPVRARLVEDPKDYRYSGYGEAVAGVKLAREGLARVMVSVTGELRTWGQVGHRYRKLLYEDGAQTEKRRGFSSEVVEQVVASGGKLPMRAALHCRVRYFSDGVVLGSKAFVDEVFARHRDEFGVKRKTGARSMRWAEWGGLCAMWDLRLQVISTGAA